MTPVNDYRTRPTGLPWLPTVPETWRIVPFRRLFRESTEVNGATPVGEMLSVSSYRGVETKHYDDDGRRRTAEEVENYRVVRPGQLAVNTMWLNYAGLGVSERLGHVSPAYRSYEIDPSLNRRFVHHLMRSSIYVDAYTALLTGIRPNSLQMSRSDLFGFPILIPPQEEQAAIAAYLDRETAEIDAFIADQETLIELLTERRMSTIAAAVSGEFSPTDGRKRFVPGFGLSPSSWQATRISRYFRITLGKMLDAGKEIVDGSEWLPYIRAANIQETGLDLTSANQMPFLPREVAQFSLKAGDLLVVEGGAVGVNIYMTEDLAGWAFQKTVNRVRPLDLTHADGRYLGYALDALRYNGTIDMIANKSTIAHLTAEKLERIVVPFPPVAEQKRLVDFLEEEMADVDATITDAREAIALSKERRAALISAAVTGKIDLWQQHGKVNA